MTPTSISAPSPAPPEILDVFEDVLLGKLLPGLLFGFFSVAMLVRAREAALPLAAAPTPATVLALVHPLLNLPFCLMQTWLFLARGKPRGRTESIGERLIALLGAFIIMLTPLVDNPVTGNAAILAAAIALNLLGGLGTIWALSHLRRHFSIIPEARGVVRTGPYAIVRHPMYASEIVWCLGLILPVFSIGVLLIYTLMVVFLDLRARFEEKLLAAHFPEYGDYRKTTWRILPFAGGRG